MAVSSGQFVAENINGGSFQADSAYFSGCYVNFGAVIDAQSAVNEVVFSGNKITGSSYVMGGSTFQGYDNTVINGAVLSIIADKAAAEAGYVSGGFVSGTRVSGAVLQVASYGYAADTELGSGAAMNVSANGAASNTVINGEGAFLSVADGGSVRNTTVGENGTLEILDGGSASVVNMSGGSLFVYSGASVEYMTNHGYLYLTIASNTEVKGYYSGAHIVNFNVPYGETVITSEGFAENTTVTSGKLTILAGGSADKTTVTSGGVLYLAGGSATEVTAEEGARINMNVVSGAYIGGTYAGNAFEMNNGFMANYAMQGEALIHSGAAISGAVVNSGASIDILEGGVLTGEITVSGGRVYAHEGGIVNLDLRERKSAESEEPDGFIINNIMAVDGAPTFTLTVSASQDFGKYSLAQNAAEFTGTITVVSGTTSCGNISVNSGVVSAGGASYTLLLEGSDLYVRVGNVADLLTPVVTAPTDWSNTDVTVTIAFDPKATANEYSLDGEEWFACESTMVFDTKGTYLFRSLDANGYRSEIAKADILIDKTAPIIMSIDGVPETYSKSAELSVSGIENESGVASIEYSTNYTDDGDDTNDIWSAFTGVTHTVVENGTYSFRIVDAAGNISAVESVNITKIDTEKPTLTVTGNPTALTEEDVVLQITSSDNNPGQQVQYSYDNVEWKSVVGNTLTVTKNATIYFKAVDAAGNESDVETVNVTMIDKYGPEITITTNYDPDTYTSGDVTVTATVTDDGSGVDEDSVMYSIDGGVTWKKGYEVTIHKNRVVTFKASDNNGRESTKEIVIDFIDKIAMEINVSGNPVEYVKEATLAVEVTDAVSGLDTLEYKVGDGEWKAVENNEISVTENCTITIKAVDKANNISTKEIVVDKIDNVLPELAVTGNITEWQKGSITLSASATDNISSDSDITIEYSTDGKNTWTSGKDAVVSANGIVYFRATDKVGNVAESAVDVTKLDNDAPTLEITGFDGSWTNKDVVLTATAGDSTSEVAKIEFTTGNGVWDEGSSVTLSANGIVTFRVTDAAGNTFEKSVNVDKIDKAAPDSPVASADITAVTAKNVTVSAEFAADSAVNEYSTDGKTWKAYPASGVVMSDNGKVYFRSTDAAGNVSAVTEFVVDNIDRVAPGKPVVSADITAPTQSDVTVTAAFASDAVRNEYSTDGKSWKAYPVGGVVMSANGTVYFRSADEVGNISEISSCVVDNIDRVAPAKPQVSADITAPTNKDVVLSAEFAADSVSNEYSLDGKVWNKYTSSGVVVTANATVYFRSTDEAGNISDVAAFEVGNIDKVAPEAPAASASVTDWTNKDVVVKAAFSSDSAVKEYSVDGGAWKSYTESGVVLSANGKVDFKAVDAAGNISSSSFTVANIDKVAPTLTVSELPAEATRMDIVVTVTSADDLSGVAAVEYSFDNKTWSAGSSVTVSENCKLYFKVTDAAGNVTTESIDVNMVIESDPKSDLLNNGTSQIVGFDASAGKVGFVAVNGKVSPAWQGVWEWSGKEQNMWSVELTGNFTAGALSKDGILLKNSSNNTFAAWTDLGSGDYGYVSLGYVDGDFKSVCLTNLGGNSSDDVIIVNSAGSFGVMIDGITYKDIWNVSTPLHDVWSVDGSGVFSTDGAEKLVVTNKTTGFVYLWENMDPTFGTWNWQQTCVANPGEGWEVAAIGDFEGDGIDDIMVLDKSTNNVWVWDDADSANRRWRGTIGNGFAIEAVGDYNGDGCDDLLLREHNTGWGGLGYWGGGYAGNWSDLNARIETDKESKFAVIA